MDASWARVTGQHPRAGPFSPSETVPRRRLPGSWDLWPVWSRCLDNQASSLEAVCPRG